MGHQTNLDVFLAAWEDRVFERDLGRYSETLDDRSSTCLTQVAQYLGAEARRCGVFDELNARAQASGGFIPFTRELARKHGRFDLTRHPQAGGSND